jgi:hypothetical protein
MKPLRAGGRYSLVAMQRSSRLGQPDPRVHLPPLDLPYGAHQFVELFVGNRLPARRAKQDGELLDDGCVVQQFLWNELRLPDFRVFVICCLSSFAVAGIDPMGLTAN